MPEMKNQNQTRTGNPAETPENQARSADGAADKNENPAPVQEARQAPTFAAALEAFKARLLDAASAGGIPYADRETIQGVLQDSNLSTLLYGELMSKLYRRSKTAAKAFFPLYADAARGAETAPARREGTSRRGKVYVIPVAIGEETAWEIAARTAKRGTGDAWDTLQAALAAAFHSAHAPANQAGRDYAARAREAFAQIEGAALGDDCDQMERDEECKYAVAAAMLDAFGRQKADISPLDRLLLTRAMLESLDSLDLKHPGAAAIRRAAEARA